MATEQKEDDQQVTSSHAVSLRGKVEECYKKIKENAETYPYVWASYITVYGGFSLWLAYRWRKLRKTEDRVKILQERLRKLKESEVSASSAAAVEKAPPSTDKIAK
ncbi:hypothetical protein HS088_TW07G00686 [Tripterygium wilfordii]|uniref:Transmembrane protein n=1 Tax=Tripterygium wilfordii TaxID=458696 RepID=A0A7J7DFD1_TRIWF|nr:uncharacterized protein LOC120002103 [Tripterygium wilfordii]XP_038706624.1 uncharacterized protein LOC120002103 [Tripterygium wilfordii]KAF5745105.1 hypothetical protein HS088_TW07G00686 [Tripterygium wilfordii]